MGYGWGLGYASTPATQSSIHDSKLAAHTLHSFRGERQAMAKDRSFSPLFFLVAVVTAVAALYFAQAILLPLALAILLCFLLTPLADRLERYHVPRVASVIIVVGMSVTVLGWVGYIVTNQLFELGRELPSHKETLVAKMKVFQVPGALSKVSQTISDLHKEFTKGSDENKDAPNPSASDVSKPPATTESPPPGTAFDAQRFNISYEAIFAQIQNWIGSLIAPFTTAGIVIILVIFILLDRENQRNRLVQLFGRAHMHSTTEAINDAARRVGRYLRMLFVVNATYGIAIAVGLGLIGVPGAMTWGVLGFSLRFLPYLGPWIAAVTPILVSIATSVGWTQPLLVVGWYVIVELVSNNVVEPLIYGTSVGISTVGVIISALFWTWIWGPIGLILAMPMTVCLIVAARYVPQLNFITILLADELPLSPPERVYQRLLAFDYLEPLKLARKHLKESSLASYYDEVLLPSLRMAEQDRHDDLLNDEQSAFIIEATEDLVEELGDEAFAAIAAKADPSAKLTLAIDTAQQHDEAMTARVLCIPLRDQADETASHMLAQLLVAEGFDVIAESYKSLASQVVDRVAESKSEVIVISAVPPIRARDSRLLWKRLRSRYPDLPIVFGFWTSLPNKEDLPIADGDRTSKAATTLTEAVSLVRTLSAQHRLTPKTA